MKRIQFAFLGVFVLFSIGCGNNGQQEQHAVKKPLKVTVSQARIDNLVRTLPFTGTVWPWKQANIQPDTSGRIGKIYVKQGDRVKQNQLLAELDNTTLKLQLKQAQAALAVAQASQKDAQLNFDRLKVLFGKQAISKMQYEKADLSLEAAVTNKKSAQATVDVIQHNLDNSFMRAPFTGVIVAKNMEEGDIINPMMGMSSSVLTLMDLNKVKVTLNIPSADIEKISLNQPCRIQVASLPDKTFSGHVYSKNLAADPVSKTFKVEIMLQNPNLLVKAGVFADVDIEIERHDNTLVIPLSAVIDNQYVMVVAGNRAVKKEVSIGLSNNSLCEITRGLHAGESVIIEGNYDLKDNSEVIVNGESHENS